MNKQMKQHLETVVNSIVSEDAEAAQAAFHDYLRLKTQAILLGEEAEDDETEEDEKDEDEKEEKSEKKSKKSDDEEDEDDEKEEK